MLVKNGRCVALALLTVCVSLNACASPKSVSSPALPALTEANTEAADTEDMEYWKEWWNAEKVSLPKSNVLQFTNGKEGIYNYCPSVIKLDGGTLYAYYCTNVNSFDVTDHIGCRKGIQGSDGSISWEEEKIVLSPDVGTWDARHTCDPSVIAGDFEYKNQKYSYMMAYLGCTSSDNQCNKIGIAVAKTPDGPFIKVGNKPLIDFEADAEYSGFQWGVGQPSLINADCKGRIWLFYTLGDKNGTRLVADEWELSELDAPERVSSEEISKKGLVNLNGGNDYMNNADLLYDAENKRFYASSDCHPNPSDEPSYISSHFRVTYFTWEDSFNDTVWKDCEVVSPQMTGFARNHNTGFLRDKYGHITDGGCLTVFYTTSVTGSDSLWSYRIYNYSIRIPK